MGGRMADSGPGGVKDAAAGDAVQAELDRLRQQLAEMTARVEALQQRAPQEPPTPPQPVVSREPEPIPEDIVLVISAAVAAYLGARVRIRHIQLITSHAWAQQGRVSIQASHRLER